MGSVVDALRSVNVATEENWSGVVQSHGSQLEKWQQKKASVEHHNNVYYIDTNLDSAFEDWGMDSLKVTQREGWNFWILPKQVSYSDIVMKLT